MEIVVSNTHGRAPVTVLRVRGDIDAATYEQLEARAREAIQAGAQNLLLDLSEAPYMSSAGIRALHNIFQMLRRADGESDAAISQGLREGTFKSPHLKLLNPSRQTRTALNAAGVDMFLEIFDDYQKAIAAF